MRYPYQVRSNGWCFMFVIHVYVVVNLWKPRLLTFAKFCLQCLNFPGIVNIRGFHRLTTTYINRYNDVLNGLEKVAWMGNTIARCYMIFQLKITLPRLSTSRPSKVSAIFFKILSMKVLKNIKIKAYINSRIIGINNNIQTSFNDGSWY